VAIASAQILQGENCRIGSIEELNNGFHFAFIAAATVAAVATILAFIAIKKSNAAGGGNKKKLRMYRKYHHRSFGNSLLMPGKIKKIKSG
jgi:hypothetical protein